jgi:hypothetical protein
MKELQDIQNGLHAPKNRRGHNYFYRSAEDILEAVKPLLSKHSCVLTLTDGVVTIGEPNRFYVKATATLMNKDGKCISTVAYAREPEKLNGMSDSQVTGATSSYARKYALNGLFAIDDSVDADTPPTVDDAVAALNAVTSRKEFEECYLTYKTYFDGDAKFMEAAKNVAKKYPKP